MARLIWDQIGERIFHAGIDCGVLYLQDGTVAVWNGLTGIEESPDNDLKSYYLDGVKYLETLSPKEFSVKLKAVTYPDEFDSVNGIVDAVSGLEYHEQPVKSFNLSYRTRIGDDIEGLEHGYKIHILYNVIANPDAHVYETLGDQLKPSEFAWTLTGTPPKLAHFRPTVHVSIDSIKTPPDIMQMVEDQLYGTDTHSPSLPSIQQLAEYFGYLGALIIVDYGDGTWAAIDESNGYITMLDETTFWIENVDATYIDADTYQVSSTNI